jgi:translation initiation factor 6
MHLLKTAFHQNPNIGLYSYANDNFCLIPANIDKKQESQVAKVLQVPTHRTNICGTSLLGAFVAGNNNSIIIPHITLQAERRLLEKLNITHSVLETNHTALGNLIVATKTAAIISPELESHKTEIKKSLVVKKVKILEIADTPVIGSLIALNDKGIYLSASATDSEERLLKNFFQLPVTRGTVNLGSPYVKAGITVNKHGFIFGNNTGGPEAVLIDSALGFMT